MHCAGTDSEKGWFLEPGKESEERVEQLFEKMESEVVRLNENSIKTTILGQETELSFKLLITQCDNKQFFLICGDGSAPCKQCDVTKKGHSLFIVVLFFSIFKFYLGYFFTILFQYF